MDGWVKIAELALANLLEGLKFLNEKNRRWFMDEYHDCKLALDAAKRLKFPIYSTVRRIAAQKRIELFLKVYHAELKATPAPTSTLLQ